MFGRAALVWLMIGLAETAQGALRRLILVPRIGEAGANQIGLLAGTLAMVAIAWLFADYLKARRPAQWLQVGILWTALTLAYEVGLARWLGYSWSRIAADYQLDRGGLMPIGLFATLLTPLAVGALRELRSGRRRPRPARRAVHHRGARA